MKWIKTFNEAVDYFKQEEFIKSEMKRFNEVFPFIGIKMASFAWHSNTEYTFQFNINFKQDGSVLKEFLINIAKYYGIEDVNRVLPVNVHGYSIDKLEVEISDKDTHNGHIPKNENDMSSIEKYVSLLKDYTYTSKHLMNIFIKGLYAFLFGSDELFFETKTSNRLVNLHFLNRSIREYMREWLTNDYASMPIPDNSFYNILYDNIVRQGTEGYRYFSLMKGTSLYDEMLKISGKDSLDKNDTMTGMGYAD
jgi:hypothetical protein